MDCVTAAKEILSGVGGFDNILDISHCSTRLRFRLKDESKVKDEQVQNIPGVLGILRRGLEYQVVIGPEVDNVYRQLKKTGISGEKHLDNISERRKELERESNLKRENGLERESKSERVNNLKEENKPEKGSTQKEKPEIHISVYSPVNGIVKPLNEVNDPAFASEILGKGIAVMPEDGKVYAPFAGTVTTVFSTLHAICLLSEQGVEMLIHIGLDTVRLNGRYFTAYIKPGDKVKKGDLILEYDLARIKEIGYDTVIPIVITNSERYKEVNPVIIQKVSTENEIMEIIKDNETDNLN
jgi:PTS system D-glucosamine-specific IIC component